jgi:hypothetical protein
VPFLLEDIVRRIPSLLAAAVTFALTAPAAVDAAAIPLAGTTSVALNADTLALVTSLGVEVTTVAPASLDASTLTARFPIVGGETDDVTGALTRIAHSGGLRFTSGSTFLELTDFVIDLRTPPTLFAQVAGVDDEVPLFDITLSTPPQLFLSEAAAAALNDTFRVSSFAAGVPIGTATIDATAPVPEPATFVLAAIAIAAVVRRRVVA